MTSSRFVARISSRTLTRPRVYGRARRADRRFTAPRRARRPRRRRPAPGPSAGGSISRRTIASASDPAALVTLPTTRSSTTNFGSDGQGDVGLGMDAPEVSVDVATRVDAAHELLTDEATLRERHRVDLEERFLRDRPLVDVDDRAAVRRPRCAPLRTRRRSRVSRRRRRNSARAASTSARGPTMSTPRVRGTTRAAPIDHRRDPVGGIVAADREPAERLGDVLDFDLHADAEAVEPVGQRAPRHPRR